VSDTKVTVEGAGNFQRQIIRAAFLAGAMVANVASTEETDSVSWGFLLVRGYGLSSFVQKKTMPQRFIS